MGGLYALPRKPERKQGEGSKAFEKGTTREILHRVLVLTPSGIERRYKKFWMQGQVDSHFKSDCQLPLDNNLSTYNWKIDFHSC